MVGAPCRFPSGEEAYASVRVEERCPGCFGTLPSAAGRDGGAAPGEGAGDAAQVRPGAPGELALRLQDVRQVVDQPAQRLPGEVRRDRAAAGALLGPVAPDRDR